MKYLFIIILGFASSALFAQNTIIWEGGTPGKESQWDEPRNWNTNKSPDENSHVIIRATNTGHQAQPIIETQINIASIQIHSGGILTIRKKGEILIDGEYTYSRGIMNYGGSLVNNGKIEMRNTGNLDYKNNKELTKN